jgi:bacterioferritin
MVTRSHENRSQIVEELKHAYNMELETVINYLSNSVHLDGVRAEEIRKSLQADIPEELGHATRVAKRLKVLESGIPGSMALKWEQRDLQPPADMTDVVAVIRGVIEAEESAIAQYSKLIEMCEGVDYVTQEMCIELLGDEEEHRRLFKGFMTEYERGAGAEYKRKAA